MNILQKVIRFYSEGFASMKLGRKLWTLVIIKLVILFAVFKLFFFPNYLNTNFKTDKERSEHILNNLTNFKD